MVWPPPPPWGRSALGPWPCGGGPASRGIVPKTPQPHPVPKPRSQRGLHPCGTCGAPAARRCSPQRPRQRRHRRAQRVRSLKTRPAVGRGYPRGRRGAVGGVVPVHWCGGSCCWPVGAGAAWARALGAPPSLLCHGPWVRVRPRLRAGTPCY